MVKTSYLKALLHSVFLILSSLEENQSQKNLSNGPWVQNSIVYTQRFHYPNMKDRLTRRSISYNSNIISGNSLDMDKYLYGGKVALKDQPLIKDESYWNSTYFLDEYNQFSTFTSKEKNITSNEKKNSKIGFNKNYVVTNMLGKEELSYMNDVVNYYESIENQTMFNDDIEKRKQVNLASAANSIDRKYLEPSFYQENNKNHFMNKVIPTNAKETSKGLIGILKAQSLAKNEKAKVMKPNYKIDPSKMASDRIGPWVGGPVITSHVVATSIHPWLFPFIYMVAEPYMSFIVFIIITIIECLGVYIGFKLDLLGLRPSEEPPIFVKASSLTIIDLCAGVTCSNTGETCVEGLCMCGTASSCVGIGSGSYCDSTNNVCKCSKTLDACSGTTDTCDNGACKCGTSSACSNSGETCSSGACKCGTASTCVGNTAGSYCDADNNVCKCSSTVAACSGTTDTCDTSTSPATCKCGGNAACSNSGEKCSSGVCKCGMASTCVGSTTAPYCDADNNICKCSSTVAACSNSGETCVLGACKCGTATTCVGNTAGSYCDAATNMCKCSSSVAACSNPGETCSSGVCKCGAASTCVGNTAGSYCDAGSSICKCSSTLAACSGTTNTCDTSTSPATCKCGTGAACSNSGETCPSGTCMCGTAATCVGQTTGAYCDAGNNVCKCSASVAKCASGEQCSGGTCVCKSSLCLNVCIRIIPSKIIDVIMLHP